jgi:putative membrane protein
MASQPVSGTLNSRKGNSGFTLTDEDFTMKLLQAIAILLMAGAFAAAHAQTTTEKPMQPSKAAELLMSNDDKTFMTKAASAGLYEVQASQLALQKAGDPSLKTFAQRMVDDHTKANSELTSLAQKKSVSLPTAPLKPEQSMLDTLNKKTGKDFDDAYRKQMVESHEKAVSLFDNEARKGKDPDVKAWAAQTLPKLQEHGSMAKELKKAG